MTSFQQYAHATPAATATATAASTDSPRQRGRRRRSSTKASTSSTAAAAATSPSAQWWERGLSPGEARQAATAEEGSQDGSCSSWSGSSVHSDEAASPSAPRSRLRIHTQGTDATSGEANDAESHTMEAPGMTASTSASSSVRSPAADFLSAFASLHSVVDSPIAAAASAGESTSGSWAQRHARSLSPAATTSHLLHAYASAAPGLPASASAAPTSSGFDLSSAAQIQPLTGAAVALLSNSNASPFEAARLPSTLPPLHARALAPDDEGATLASGRYVLGRAIGFGGSSTVREAWDRSSATTGDEGELRRVAVKIVRMEADAEDGAAGGGGSTSRARQQVAVLDDEVGLWSSLPEHTHLLPLLHHEVVPLQRSGGAAASLPPSSSSSAAGGGGGRIIFLVMPFADAGSLLDYVRNEGTLPASSSASGTSSLARSTSLHAALNAPSSAAAAALHQGGSLRAPRSHALHGAGTSARTGSGFLPSKAARVFSDGTSNAPSSFSLATAGAGAGGAGGGATSLSSSARPYGNGSLSPRSSLGASLSAAGASGTLLRRGSSRLGAPPSPRSRGLRMREIASVTKQLCAALEALQKCGVRHADLKLENVLGQCVRLAASRAAAGGEAEGGEEAVEICWRLADFGLAVRVGDGEAEEGETHGNRRARGGENEPMKVHTGGSLAYAPPEALRSPSTPSPSRAQAEEQDVGTASPFAADHWALGCIIYALFSGKLPFSDSFEPRLQLKIARGEWAMPVRLERRHRAAPPPAVGTHSRRAEAASEADVGIRASGSALTLPSIAAGLSASGSIVDMSASMPTLPPRPIESTSSAALSDESESEDEETASSVDAEELRWNGTRAQRSAARQLLKGLLDTQPAKRWTLQDVLASRFLACTELPSHDEKQALHVHLAPPSASADLPASLRDALSPPPTSATAAAAGEEPLRFSRQASRERSSSSSKRDSSLSRSRPPSDSHAHARGRGRAPRGVMANESRSNSGSPAPRAGVQNSSVREASFDQSTSDAALSFRLEDLGDETSLEHEHEHERETVDATAGGGGAGAWERGRGRAQWRQMTDVQEDKTWDASLTSSSSTGASGARHHKTEGAKQTNVHGRSTPIDIAPRDSSGSRSRSRTRGIGGASLLADSFERAEPGGFTSSAASPALRGEQWQGRPAMLRSASHELSSRGRPSEPTHSGVASSAHLHARPTTGAGAGSGSGSASGRAFRGTSRSTSRPRVSHSTFGLHGGLHGSTSASSKQPSEFILPAPSGPTSEAFSRFPAASQTSPAEEKAYEPVATAVATRSSTSRSRSRAPDQLKGLLAREREAASSSGGGSPAQRRSREASPAVGAAAEEGEEGVEPEAEQWWQRGRGREVRAARGAAGGSESSSGGGKKSSRWPWQA